MRHNHKQIYYGAFSAADQREETSFGNLQVVCLIKYRVLKKQMNKKALMLKSLEESLCFLKVKCNILSRTCQDKSVTRERSITILLNRSYYSFPLVHSLQNQFLQTANYVKVFVLLGFIVSSTPVLVICFSQEFSDQLILLYPCKHLHIEDEATSFLLVS